MLLGPLSYYLGWFALRLGQFERVDAAFNAAQGYYCASSQEVRDQAAQLLDRYQITLTLSDVAAALEQVQPDAFSVFLADLAGRLEIV